MTCFNLNLLIHDKIKNWDCLTAPYCIRSSVAKPDPIFWIETEPQSQKLGWVRLGLALRVQIRVGLDFFTSIYFQDGNVSTQQPKTFFYLVCKKISHFLLMSVGSWSFKIKDTKFAWFVNKIRVLQGNCYILCIYITPGTLNPWNLSFQIQYFMSKINFIEL